MFTHVMKEKELLGKLNSQLNDLKIFIIGCPVDEKECCTTMKSSECLNDELINNINGIEYALKQVELIANAIKGDK